ncbi:hypothetical protein DPMN_078247 [Dreissena polymorpha]|uniref:Uncharacterized protein n=1 Tax=Dreissena polymorpha TaxID=45954 RepID=A0A9D4BQC1_DREPO|nr:hypothetical protein DPMN_078247 [Dreissena polymorpha]
MESFHCKNIHLFCVEKKAMDIIFVLMHAHDETALLFLHVAVETSPGCCHGNTGWCGTACDRLFQAIKADLLEGRGATALPLTQRTDKKSPGHDGKSTKVNFTFTKKISGRLTNAQTFIRDTRAAPVEIRILQPENSEQVESRVEEPDPSPESDTCNKDEAEEEKSEKVGESVHVVVSRPAVMSSFVKVQSKDDNGKVLDWPKEMIKYTQTEPKVMFSCNPLAFDFSQLFGVKSKKSSGHAEQVCTQSVDSKFDTEQASKEESALEHTVADGADKLSEEKKKSHRKKKKKKHKKNKESKAEVKEDGKEAGKDDGKEECNKMEADDAVSSGSKKKKRKHKKKEDKDVENKDEKSAEGDDKEKKRHKKSKRKSKTEEPEGEKVEGEDADKKPKKRKKKHSKKKKRKHNEIDGEKSDKEAQQESKEKNESDSDKDSDDEKGKENKKKRKKRRKHKKKGNNENYSSENETNDISTDAIDTATIQANAKRKVPGVDSDHENDKIVAKLQALNRTKAAQKQAPSNTNVQKKIKKEPSDVSEKKTPSDRKRVNSESSVNEATPVKKTKVTPKNIVKDTLLLTSTAHVSAEVKVEKEESWSHIETQTNDNVKSKWDTSDSDADNALDDTLKKDKSLKKRIPNKTVKGPPINEIKNSRVHVKTEVDSKKGQTTSSQRSNFSIGSGSKLLVLKTVGKAIKSPASSRSRSHSRRSYSRSGSSSRSRSRSYSSSSYYSDDSRKSRRRRHSRSYSSSHSRSHSYHRHSRSYSYTDSEYSRSRSYSSSRSRSRSHRRRSRSYSRSHSRSYSTSSYSSRSRSRGRSYGRKRKHKRRNRQRPRSLSVSPVENIVAKKVKELEQPKEKDTKVDPADIPLPDLSGKKEDETSEAKLLKLKEKKRRTDVGETVAKLVENLPENIPLPFSEGDVKTVSSDSLPHGSPKEAPKETDSGFIGPKMPAPPPPPPMGRGFGPNHGPPGPIRPYGPGQWDEWGYHGWDGPPGPWDGPGPGPRPYRGMRPPFGDPRMYGPRRGPHPFMNRPRGPPPPYGMGPRYPGPHVPYPEYMDYDYDPQYAQEKAHEEAKEESKTPPPLPKEPPKSSTPKPPLPKKKEKKEPEQNPDIVIPPEQAEQYKYLQKQAQKHARRQQRRQAKRDLGEPDDDSTSSESEPEEQQVVAVEALEEANLDELQAQMVIPQMVLAQPQPASSPSGAYILVSGGQQYLVHNRPMMQAAMPIQAGQPVIAAAQGGMMATAHAAALGAQPAHLLQGLPAHMFATPAHLGGGAQMMMTSASLQQLQQMQQFHQLQQIHQAQQVQAQAQAIHAHNQAVAMAAAQQGPIIVGNQILVPRLSVRPAI